MKLTTGFFTGWRVASKTQPIKAKPLINLLVDRTVASKFLVDTLEGKEPLGDGVVICVGGAGDAWQQMPAKLLKKYDVTQIDTDGWMICAPKPDNAVNCIEITKEFLTAARDTNLSVPFPDDRAYNLGDFCINGQYGSNEHPEFGTNVQWGDAGTSFVRTAPTRQTCGL